MKFLIFLFITMIISTSSFSQNIPNEVETLSSKRFKVESIIDRTPYTNEQHELIKDYFDSINTFASQAKNNNNFRNRMNNSINSSGTENFCKKTYLDLGRWQSLIKNCDKNGFFICAEEVKSFLDARALIRKNLSLQLQKNYDSTMSCLN